MPPILRKKACWRLRLAAIASLASSRFRRVGSPAELPPYGFGRNMALARRYYRVMMRLHGEIFSRPFAPASTCRYDALLSLSRLINNNLPPLRALHYTADYTPEALIQGPDEARAATRFTVMPGCGDGIYIAAGFCARHFLLPAPPGDSHAFYICAHYRAPDKRR